MTKYKIDLIMYNCLNNKPKSYFIKADNKKRQVERQEIFDTIKHYYKLANEGKIQLGENYYCTNGMEIKTLYITEK